jgi:REP element-mobilizing transposase RayT
MKYLAPFVPQAYYHVFSHANGFENIFLDKGNFEYFLRQFEKYISPVADTYAYCLMPNHFHFLIKIKSLEDLKIPDDYSYDIHKFVMQHWSNMLNSYSKAFNKMHNRRGALFINQLRRSYIDSEEYLYKTLHYIHDNPVKHQFKSHAAEWFYSSIHNYRHAKDLGILANDSKLIYQQATHVLSSLQTI